ncbi:MAG: ferritin-like domain-containing protein [Myxococcota bacterium]|nr:ferritin-like domain-containing protein [Myxococcota bacterium]
MRRFISPDELARDRRFKRVNPRNQLLESLPDEVDDIVRVFETIGPKLRERVEGTELAEVYDDLGPGFQFLTASGGRQGTGERSSLQMRMQLHGIFVGELQALEAAGRTIWDFPEAPWDFKMNMARQCWDEGRHVQIFEKLMDHVGGEIGAFPESTFLFEASCHDDPVLRITGVNRCLEGLACDVFRSLIDHGKQVDDDLMAQAVDFVLADELTHVRFGSDWTREFTKDDPERAERAREFQRETERAFSFGGRQIARAERAEAGFSEEELDEIEELAASSGAGPRRETLVAAAELLRDRHQARKRGEDVPPLDA